MKKNATFKELISNVWFYIRNFRTINKKLKQNKKQEKVWENSAKRLSQSKILQKDTLDW